MNNLSYAQLLQQAKQRILHQDDALARLAVILHYHKKFYEACAKELLDKELDALFTTGKPDWDLTPETEPIGTAPVFLLGKTGSGKTHLVSELCKVAGVNFVTVNATHLSNAGYKGFNLADVGEMIVEKSNKSPVRALFSVVFFDEFDKLFMPTNDYHASFQKALATEFLTIFEGNGTFPVKDKAGIPSGYMLFILGGSFGLHKNDKSAPIGFLADDNANAEPKNQLDFLQKGFFEELAGRIGQTISLAPLTNAMLADILKNSPSSPLVKLQKQLNLEMSHLDISDDFVEYLVEQNAEAIEKFGVRGLYQAFNALPAIHEVLVMATQEYGLHFLLDKDGIQSKPIYDYEHYESMFLGVDELTPPSKPVQQSDDYDDMPF